MKAKGIRTVTTLAIVLVLYTSACAVKFVSDYDETTEKMATDLQKKIDGTMAKWEIEPPNDAARTYAANKAFYADVLSDLNVLRTRVSVQPNNPQTTGIVDTVIDSMKKIRDFHAKQNTVSTDTVIIEQRAIDQQLGDLIALELAKKRGEKPTSAK